MSKWVFFLLLRALEKNRTAKYQKIFPTGQTERSIIRVLLSRRLLMDCRNFCWLTVWLFWSSDLGRCSPSIPGNQELILPAIMRPAGEQRGRIQMSALPLGVQSKPLLPVTSPVDTQLKSNLLENY